jgi:putative FmdB family regulatory protein
MSPLYVFRCPNGHDSEHLRPMAERDAPVTCLRCGGVARRIMAPAHVPPDGIYSHTPNVGDPREFERKHEARKRR